MHSAPHEDNAKNNTNDTQNQIFHSWYIKYTSYYQYIIVAIKNLVKDETV